MNGRAWSADDLGNLRRLVAAGMTDAEIGKDMARHPKLVGNNRRALGLQPGRSPKLNAMMARINLRRMLTRESRQ